MAGSIKKEWLENNKKTKLIDFMKIEQLAILNAVSTAEGAIETIISNTNTILQGSKVLILGFGRIGKVLSKKLEALSAQITVSARKKEDLAWIQAYGYEVLNINTLGKELEQFDIIINTAPHIILTKERLKYVKQDILLVELASKPGGMDIEEIEKLKLKRVNAQALPGKVAPVTSAKIIKEAIYNVLENDEI